MVVFNDVGQAYEKFRVTLTNASITEQRMDLDYNAPIDSFYFIEKFHLKYQSISLENFDTSDVSTLTWQY